MNASPGCVFAAAPPASIGGIIAPGLAAMTNYLHEKTALLPKIEIRDIATAIGKSTEQAMLVGAVHGYRGLVRELIAELKRELHARKLPVVATGGYARLIGHTLILRHGLVYRMGDLGLPAFLRWF